MLCQSPELAKLLAIMSGWLLVYWDQLIMLKIGVGFLLIMATYITWMDEEYDDDIIMGSGTIPGGPVEPGPGPRI